MSDHEALCRWHGTENPRNVVGCRCALIAQVRADERERIAQAIERRAEVYTKNPIGIVPTWGAAFEISTRIARGEF